MDDIHEQEFGDLDDPGQRDELEGLEDSEFDPFATPPIWPKVIGIISITLSGLALTCTGCGVTLLVAAPFTIAGGTPPPMLQLTPIEIALAATSLGLACLLLVAGIMTVSRSVRGRVLHLVYALFGIPFSIISAILKVQVQRQKQIDMAAWVQNNPESPFAQSFNAQGGGTSAMVGIVIILFIGVAYPLFILIWFGLVKRRAEDMTGGSDNEVL